MSECGWEFKGKQLDSEAGSPLNELPRDGKFLCTSYAVAKGLMLLGAEIDTPVSTLWTSRINTEATMAIRIILSGRDKVTCPHFNEPLDHNEDSYNICMSPTSEASFFLDASSHSHSLALIFTPERLRSFAADHRLPKEAHDFLDGREYFYKNFRTSTKLRQLALKMKSCPYTGTMKSIFLHGKAYEVLAETMPDIDGTMKDDKLSPNRERPLAFEARDILVSDLAAPPTIDSLARRLGTNPRKLNQAFNNTFGKSVFDCLADWRLELACSMLRDTNLTIKEIAFRLGYAYANNFINAFTRRYGTTPRKYKIEGQLSAE